MRKGKFTLFFLFSIIVLRAGVSAQDTYGGHFAGGDGEESVQAEQVAEKQPDTQNYGDWSHFDCVIAPSISAGLSLTPLLLDSVFNFNYWGFVGMMAGSIVPVYFVNPLDGLFLTLGMGGLIGIEQYLDSRDDTKLFDQFAYTWIMEAGFYSSYVAYCNSRIHAAKGVYNDNWKMELGEAADFMMIEEHNPLDITWKPYSFGELFAAPLDGKHYSDVMMWLLPIAGVIGPLIMYPHTEAMWTTGKCYMGQWEVPAYISIPVMLAFFYLESSVIAISEESLFRGFLFEDIASSGSVMNALIFDCLFFPAVHIPQEIEMGYNGGTIALDFLRRGILTFYLDLLYSRGGLTHSVTAHMLIDFSQLFTLWMMHAGAPQDEISDIIGMVTPVEFAVRIPF